MTRMSFCGRCQPTGFAIFTQAGHYVEAPNLRVDTHGAAVDEAAWQLLEEAYELFGPVPTLLERDFNFPPVEELLAEVGRIRNYRLPPAARRPQWLNRPISRPDSTSSPP